MKFSFGGHFTRYVWHLRVKQVQEDLLLNESETPEVRQRMGVFPKQRALIALDLSMGNR